MPAVHVYGEGMRIDLPTRGDRHKGPLIEELEFNIFEPVDQAEVFCCVHKLP